MCNCLIGHCFLNVTKIFRPDQKVTDPESFWKLTVDMHNSVNKRSKTKEITYEEAERYLLQNLTEYGSSVEELNNQDVYMNQFTHMLFSVASLLLDIAIS